MRRSKARIIDSASENDENKTGTDSDDSNDNDGDECPPPSYSGPFSQGQKVLAYHMSGIYEAKVSKIEFRKKEWRYYVHYLGWNKNWDEWVGMDRLMIYNEENVQKQKDLDKKQGTDKNTNSGRASLIKPRNSAVASSKKRKNDSVIKLVKLPCNPNVDDILNKYFNDSLKNDMNRPREQEVGIDREAVLNGPRISRLNIILRSPHQSTMDPNSASIGEEDECSPLIASKKKTERGPTSLTIGVKGTMDPNSAPIGEEDGSSPLAANKNKTKRGRTSLTIGAKGTMDPNSAPMGEQDESSPLIEDRSSPLAANKKKTKRGPTSLTIGAKGKRTMDPISALMGEQDESSPLIEDRSSPLAANKKKTKRGPTSLTIGAKGTMDPNSAPMGEQDESSPLIEDRSSPLVANEKKTKRGPTSLTIGANVERTMDPNSAPAPIGKEDGSSPLTKDRSSPLAANKKRTKRGPTSLTIGAKGKGKKYKHELEFNQKGQPTGKSRKLTATDCGKLCRLYAPVNCRTWKKVPQSAKDKILEVIEENYECKKTQNWKTRVLYKVGNRFRGFKHDMYKRFILPNLDNLEKMQDPPAEYSTITPEQWTDFVAQRTCKSWTKVRKKAQETRSKNVYVHRLSRKGYAGLEEELQLERNSSEPIERHTLWKVAHQKDGVYVNERVRETAEKIDELSQQVEEGSLTVEGSKDVLTQALGTQEHSGRVRGVGYLVTPTSYFQTPRLSSTSFQAAMKEMTDLKKYMMTLTSEVQRLKQLRGQATPFCPSTSPNVEKSPNDEKSPNVEKSPDVEKVGSNSIRGSVGLESPQLSPSQHWPASPMTNIRKGKGKQAVVETNPSPPRPPPDKRNVEKDKSKQVVVQTNPVPPMPPNDKMKPRACWLALGSIDRVVAHGHLHDAEGSNLLHGSPLGEGNACVSVNSLEKAEYGSEHLPIPTPDANTLAEAVRGFVAWPKHLVILKTTMGQLKAPTRQGEFDFVVKNFANLVDRATKQTPSAAIYVEVDREVFQSSDPLYNLASEIPVFRDELMDLINYKEIGVAVMKLYMCALYNKVKELGVDHTFRFAAPAGARGHTGTDNVDQLFYTLETAEREQLFFYPFNIGFHWVLAIIDPWHRHTLYFDPLGNEVDGNVDNIVSYACKNLDYSFKFTASKKKATFEIVTCPRQAGAVECGYYILRYMKDVIHLHGTYPAQVFDNDECYGRDLIDEVRVELMNYIRDNM